jgi:hypothetical protein
LELKGFLLLVKKIGGLTNEKLSSFSCLAPRFTIVLQKNFVTEFKANSLQGIKMKEVPNVMNQVEQKVALVIQQ